jgi:BirA family biotin operon repressor/biotin-[acetyl-CoA-carboxylase] ligase
MYLVKLNAINSTNSYLKKLSKDLDISNWTVITAEYQTVGRGQMQTKWESEKGKNLICSVLIRLKDLKVQDQFYLNCAISLGIFNVLKGYNLKQLRIKWPNDIMSVNKKLGGVLIENSLTNNIIYQTVIGIGINVNQEIFINLPKASSMKQLLKRDFDRDILLNQIIVSLEEQISRLEQKNFTPLHRDYEAVLYKKNIPNLFEQEDKKKFMGKILGISEQGNLIIEKENQSVREYGFKEIKLL